MRWVAKGLAWEGMLVARVIVSNMVEAGSVTAKAQWVRGRPGEHGSSPKARIEAG